MKVTSKPLDDLKQMIESLVQCSSVASVMQVDVTAGSVKGFHFMLSQATERQRKYCESLEVMAKEKANEPSKRKVKAMEKEKAEQEVKVVHYPIQ